jgi:hypothetical protein
VAEAEETKNNFIRTGTFGNQSRVLTRRPIRTAQKSWLKITALSLVMLAIADRMMTFFFSISGYFSLVAVAVYSLALLFAAGLQLFSSWQWCRAASLFNKIHKCEKRG